jgi:hypothetical protein
VADALRILAGRDALPVLRERGLDLSTFGVLIAPAGGTKFLMLGGLDRVLFPALRATPRERPLHCVGSSIGAVRLACLFARDPVAALERVASTYLEYRRGGAVDGAAFVRQLVANVLRGELPETIADPPLARLHVLTSLCRGLAASDRRPLLLSGLGVAAAANLLSRRSLGLQFTRAVFHSRGDTGPLSSLDDLPTRHARLTPENLPSVLAASSAVPLLVPGASIPGESHGVYRDGALLDYHPVFDTRSVELVLYPHFFPYLTPGWFDRSLPFRRARGRLLHRTVVLAPSEAFVAGLPGGVVPTRKDLRRFEDEERLRRWREVWSRGRALGNALGELISSPRRVAALVKALD